MSDAFWNPDDEPPVIAKGKAHRKGKANGKEPPPEEPQEEADDDDQHLPIMPIIADGRPFPIDYLPPILKKAVVGIAALTQVPQELAVQSVLGAAALACQPLADVTTPSGQITPLSLFVVSLARSGARKTSADDLAMEPFTVREGELRADYDMLRDAFDKAAALWEAERKAIMGGKKPRDQRKYDLDQMARKPEPPLMPELTIADTTIEGLLKRWSQMQGSLGLFTDEGGAFIGGYSMRGEGKLSGGATLSKIWDGKPIRRMRAGDETAMPPLYGRRLSAHLMIQPDVAIEFLTNDTLEGQGFHSRVLLAMPPDLIGTRLFRKPDSQALVHMSAYNAHMLELLRKPWPLAEHSQNELRPRVLAMEEDAKKAWIIHYDEIEKQSGKDGRFAPLVGFGSKAGSITARIAAIFTLIEDADAPKVTALSMINAIEVMRWYLDEAVRVRGWATSTRIIKGTEGEAFAAHRIDKAAEELLAWVKRQAGGQKVFEIRRKQIMQKGPAGTRRSTNLASAIRSLSEAGYIVSDPNDQRKFPPVVFNL